MAKAILEKKEGMEERKKERRNERKKNYRKQYNAPKVIESLGTFPKILKPDQTLYTICIAIYITIFLYVFCMVLSID